jgi:hypothetical protein
MQIFNNALFWILLFITQVYLLSILSNKLFNFLYRYLFKIFKRESTVVFVISLMFLPGTFIHELSHAITATLMGSRVTKFSVWPQVENGGIKMGYAQFIVLDVVRNTFIGIAPLIFGVIILYFLIINFFIVNIYLKILFIYLIFQVSNSMFLSESDIKDLKFLSLIVLVLSLILFIGDIFYLKFGLFEKLNFNFLSNININFLLYLNIFFTGTLVMNLVILGIVKLLNKFHRY